MKVLTYTPLLAALFLSSSAHALPNVQLAFLRPPDAPQSGYTSFGVVGLSGFEARAAEDAIVQAFLDDSRGLAGSIGGNAPAARPNHFPVVERSRLSTVLGEQLLGQGGTLDPGTAARLGEVMGAGLIITGHVASPSSADEWSTKTKKEQRGENTYTVTYQCVERTVEVSFAMRVLDATTGQILDAHPVAGTNRASNCALKREAALAATPSAHALARDVLPRLGVRSANRVAPYWEVRTFKLERQKATKEGVNLLKQQGDIVGAASWFLAAAEADTYSDWLQYHAAVALAITHHYDEAAAKLAAARALNDRSFYRSLAEQIPQMRANFDALSALGLPMAPIDVGGATGGSAPADDKVTLRGSTKKRYPLLSSPGGGSEVAQLPGKMTVTELSQQGGYIKVRTFDGKTGWVSAEHVQ